jgi:hypothetical protein
MTEAHRDEGAALEARLDLRQPAPVAFVEQLSPSGDHQHPGQLGEVTGAVRGPQASELARGGMTAVDRGR